MYAFPIGYAFQNDHSGERDYTRYVIEITDITALLGTPLDEARITGLNERVAAQSPFSGTFSADATGTILYLSLTSAADWPNCVGALQKFLADEFGLQPVQYALTPDDDTEYYLEVTGEAWCYLSGGTIYDGPNDLIGMPVNP